MDAKLNQKDLAWKRSRIWNDDDNEYVEEFNEKEIRIPAHNYIEMTRHDASRFLHQWRDPVDQRTKVIKYPKKLRIDPVYDYVGKGTDNFPKNACVICKMNCVTPTALKKHMASAHPDVIIVKKEDEKDDARNIGDDNKEQV